MIESRQPCLQPSCEYAYERNALGACPVASGYPPRQEPRRDGAQECVVKDAAGNEVSLGVNPS